MIYAAQYSKEGEGKYIVAGGSGSNEAKVFDHKNENSVIGMYHELRLLPFSLLFYFLLFTFYFLFFIFLFLMLHFLYIFFFIMVYNTPCYLFTLIFCELVLL